MIRERTEVVQMSEVAPGILVLSFHSKVVAAETLPGQFVNIRVGDQSDPLLRRPFSVYQTEKETVSVLFNIVGRGTELLARMRPGEALDVLGPLGSPFGYNQSDVRTGILVGGGLGVAPFPILSRFIRETGRDVITLLGARTASQLVTAFLENVSVATDDGSRGFSGNVVDLARTVLREREGAQTKIFACGPTPMLRAVTQLAVQTGIACEISLEGPMGCGFGICQGCPVELVNGERKYALMCKDGPVFDCRAVRI